MENRNSLDNSLAVIEVASLALGYAALGSITRDETLRVLDASPLGGGRFLILLQGEPKALKEALTHARSALDGTGPEVLIDHEMIENIERAVPEALFSLSKHELDETLIVIESATVSGMLSLAQLMVHVHHLKAIEIKIHRGSTGGAYGFFTGSAKDAAPAAEDARTHLRSVMREGRVETIEAPSKSFRHFFNLSGN